MKTHTVIIALAATLFALPAGAQTAREKEKIAEKAYLYATFCEDSKSSYRTKACEALFTVILTDLGGSGFRRIAPRKFIDKIHDIID